MPSYIWFVHFSLAFRGFVLRGSQIQGSPKNKSTSLGPFNGQQHQNCSTTRTGLRATPRDVQGVGRKKRSSCHHSVAVKTRKTLRNSKTLLLWGPQLFADFRSSREVLKPTPRKNLLRAPSTPSCAKQFLCSLYSFQ